MEKKGRYGEFGGQYAAETLMNALINLEEAFNKYKDDEDFNRELNYYHKQYTGRPSILYYAEKMTKDLGGAKIYLKREDLNHTGAHKINNVIGQCLLAKRMGKKKVIAETGAGQHGVATATFAAVLGLECDVYMGEEYMDVIGDGNWERSFTEKPAVFTREEKRAWLDQMQDVTLGSDAFFPFSDNIERAHKSGVKYIAQPGGSVRDSDVIACCDKYDMVMAFTGIRLFHH